MSIIVPPYHFAIVVEDIDKSMAELTKVLGLSWSKVMRRPARLENPTGEPTTLDVAFTYSLQGPPHFELLERREGTVFDKLGLHHIGMWSDDPAAESRRLESMGWPFETVGLKPDGTRGGGLYHRGPDELRIEIIDIAVSGPKYVRFLNGGDYA